MLVNMGYDLMDRRTDQCFLEIILFFWLLYKGIIPYPWSIELHNILVFDWMLGFYLICYARLADFFSLALLQVRLIKELYGNQIKELHHSLPYHMIEFAIDDFDWLVLFCRPLVDIHMFIYVLCFLLFYASIIVHMV